jgi:excisionase family DNA binding protein
MRFYRDLTTHHQLPDNEPPANKPVPMRPKDRPSLDAGERLADLKMVAQQLGVSTRYVQKLVRRRAIPVIRLGRRCTRFDLPNVITAVKKFEIRETGR